MYYQLIELLYKQEWRFIVLFSYVIWNLDLSSEFDLICLFDWKAFQAIGFSCTQNLGDMGWALVYLFLPLGKV